MSWQSPVGAHLSAEGTRFRVWAAHASTVDVVLYTDDTPAATHTLQAEGNGYFGGTLPGIGAGQRYAYRIDGGDPRPDPASRLQPVSVHGPSEVVDTAAHQWHDDGWCGIPLDDAIIYELHIGTFTAAGTFDAAIERLDDLVELGITAIEIMPVADFPGERNWGYDGVCLWAPARAYGGSAGLQRLVDAAHQRGLAVFLDVVYNHLGPDGNYLRDFSPAYFTSRHHTPWGDALNFDDTTSGPVREFFIANACHWACEYHIDGLRLDATHAIQDTSQVHILTELANTVRATLPPDRHFLLIAEDERNDAMLLRAAHDADLIGRMADADAINADVLGEMTPTDITATSEGYGLDAVWADDFHHQVRVALTGEREAYFADFSGTVPDLVATLDQGWFYTGQASAVQGHARGTSAYDIAPGRFVYCIQNHDQVGNRPLGDRLNHTVSPAAYRMASALLLLSPYTPMLWQGQEWAASTPFLFFTHHNDDLGRLVTEGRRSEFGGFAAFTETVPDPQAEQTFSNSKLRWEEASQPPHAPVRQMYRDLIAMRKTHPALVRRDRASFEVAQVHEAAFVLRRTDDSGERTLLVVVNPGGPLAINLDVHKIAAGTWRPIFDTNSPAYGGGTPATYQNGTLTFADVGVVVLER